MSAFYTAGGSGTEEECLKTIARANELGVTMLDTADMYGFGKNEQLLGALRRFLCITPLPFAPAIPGCWHAPSDRCCSGVLRRLMPLNCILQPRR